MPVESSVYTALIAGFTGNPALLLLAIVLIGIGFLAYKLIGRFLVSFSLHSEKMSASMESMAKDFNNVKEDIHDLKRDIAVIAEKVSAHEVRINRLEDKD